MEFTELLTSCRSKKVQAKALSSQRYGGPLVIFGLQSHPVGSAWSAIRSFSSLRALRLCGKLLLGLSLFAVGAAQQRHSLVPADILRVANVGDAQISPSGDWVVYTVSAVEGDATRSTLWLANAAFEGRPGVRNPPTETRTDFEPLRQLPTQLLPSGWYGSNPRWSPDGKSIAFLADHETQKGIWIVTLDRQALRFVEPF